MSDPLPVPDAYAALIEGLFDEYDEASENDGVYMSQQSPFQRWQGLFNEIRRGNMINLNLISGGNDGQYDVRNRELIQSVKLGLLEALESPNARMLVKLSIGQALLSQLTKAEQKRLFQAVFQRDMPQRYEINIGSYDLDDNSMESSEDIPSSFQSSIDTAGLSDAMRNARPTIAVLRLQHIHFASIHQIFRLADCIEQSKETIELIDLRHLSFDESILRPMTSSGQAFYPLDRIFCAVCKAGRNLKFFSISGPKQSTQRLSIPLVSPEVMRLLFLSQRDWDDLWLRHLGLEDEHCRQIAEGIKAEELRLTELPAELVTHLEAEAIPSENLAKAKEASLEIINEEKSSFRLLRFSLNGNPAITNAGYQAIFHFIDEMKIQGLEWVSVSNDIWDAKFNLVMKMNWYLDRREYMTKNVFRSRKSCFNFLHRVNAAGDYDGIQLDSLYFTLRENPEFIANTLRECKRLGAGTFNGGRLGKVLRLA